MTNTKHPSKSIKIVFWNTNSLINEKSEFADFLDRTETDICHISETLNPDKKFNIPNYNSFFDLKSRGTAIFVKKSFCAYHISSPPSENLETTIIRIELPTGHLKIVSLYQSPSLDIIPTDYKNIFSSNEPTLIAGDSNAKYLAWNSDRNDSRGTCLFKLIDKYNLNVAAPNSYTHYPRSGAHPNVLDFAIC